MTPWASGDSLNSTNLNNKFGLGSSFVNVKDAAYGAQGDGVTNDAVAITSAFSAGAGGVIYLPPGTYLTSTLTLSQTSTTILAYGGAVLKKTGVAGNALLRVSGNSCTIDGLGLDGVRASFNGINDSGILLNATGCVVRNCNVTNAGSYGIRMSGAPNSIIRANRLSGNSNIGIYAEQNSTGVLIEGNDVDARGGVANAHAIALHSTTAGQSVNNGRIADNRCQNNGANSFCIEVGAFSGDRPVGLVIANNVCSSTSSSDGGISISGADYASVTGNTYSTPSGTSATIAGIEIVFSTRVAATGNVLTGGDLVRGITVDEGSSYCVVTGNVIDSVATGGSGIFLTTSTASNLVNNVVANNVIRLGTGAGSGYGVRLQCNHASAIADDNAISGNQIIGSNTGGSKGIDVSQDAGTLREVLLTGNTISHVSTAINSNTTVYVIGSLMTDVTTSYGGSGQYFRFDPQNGQLDSRSGLTLNTSGALLLTAGSAVRPRLAYTSEESLGWYRSTTSTQALSYGTLDLTAAHLSVRTTATSLTSVTVGAAELAFFVGGTSGATLGLRSGGTLYFFASSSSTVG